MAQYTNIIIQIILIVVLIIVAFLLMRLRKTTNLEKRITKFSIDSITEKSVSFFDRVENFYYKFVDIVTVGLKKTKIFTSYGKKYEIYIDQTKIIRDEGISFIAHKILIALIATIVTIISDVLRLQVITPLQLILAFLIGFFVPDIFLMIEHNRRSKRIEEDLLKAIIIMGNAFKSGRSIMQSVELVVSELDGPISDEFKKMYIDLTYGLELEVVFKRFSDRVKIDEIKYMAASLVILNKTGGNVVKVFSSIERGFFDRKKLKDELKSITALSDLVFKVLIAIPFLIFLVICFFNPQYFVPLVTSIIGKVMLVLILLIYTLYIVIAKNITKYKE